MRYVIIALLLIGCGSESQKTTDDKINYFAPVESPKVTHRSMGVYGGEIEIINNNSWNYFSNKNYSCVNKNASVCRKAMSSYTDIVATNRIVKTDFVFTLVQYNPEKAPYWVIIYQDWVRIIPTDTNGNHPISTIKLKSFDDKPYLCHYDNSWQWGYDFGENRDGDAIDIDHTLHQENTKNGCKKIDINVTYNVTILNNDKGEFAFYVNDGLVSKRKYQTKSKTEKHVIQWGIYTSKDYNLNNNPELSVILSVDNFNLYSLRK